MSARLPIIIFLIFIYRNAVDSYDIKRLESTMKHMAKGMENNFISSKESKHILNEFQAFGEFVANETKDNPEHLKIINGPSGQVYSMYFDFTPKKPKKTSKKERYKYSYQFNN